MRLTFIVCPSFHGSTLLHLLLNNHSRISALGDTNPSRAYDQMCACGRKVSQCDYWLGISTRLRSDRFEHRKLMLPILPWPLESYRVEGRAVPVTRSEPVNRAIGRTAAAVLDVVLPFLWRRGTRRLDNYFRLYSTYYEHVLALHGTQMIVDGSKSGRKVALFARRLPPGDVKVIHLVRDPRGFAASWRHNGEGKDVGAAAWLWRDIHGRYEALQTNLPYCRVRYEDLATDTPGELERILEFIEAEPQALIAPPQHPEKHHLMGNRMLFTFDGTVRLDEAWRERLTVDEQRLVLARAGELARKLGYA